MCCGPDGTCKMSSFSAESCQYYGGVTLAGTACDMVTQTPGAAANCGCTMLLGTEGSTCVDVYL